MAGHALGVCNETCVALSFHGGKKRVPDGPGVDGMLFKRSAGVRRRRVDRLDIGKLQTVLAQQRDATVGGQTALGDNTHRRSSVRVVRRL
ncbi:MAG: hypothetical protein WCA53_11855 [Caballeronia sp.]